jgi:acyl-CoA synthetase (AMP-forming)/AMP-acid ligase II
MQQAYPGTLAELPRLLAASHGRRPAVIDAHPLTAGETWDFAALDVWSSQVANGLLAGGLGRGECVAQLSADGPQALALLFGAAKAGGAYLGLNPRLAEDELAFILEDAGARWLFCGPEQADMAARLATRLPRLERRIHLEIGEEPAPQGELGFEAWCKEQRRDDPLLPIGPEDLAAQIYTSGTTGLPKGVQLAHRSFFAVVRAMRAAGDPWIGWSDADVSLHNIPLFHIGGLWWALTTLGHGAPLVTLPAWHPGRALEAIERERVTKACLVPAMIGMLLREPRVRSTDVSSLGHLVYGGSPIPVPILEEGLEVLGCEFAQIYGLTETGNTAVCLRPEDHRRAELLTAAGRPYPGVRLKIVDTEGAELPTGAVGEICIHSPANMLGYHGRPEATAETLRDGWVHTGDAGYLNDEGFVLVSDRIKDMILVAGENVYPAEIESVLQSHPKVAEVAVIGIPDERWGESIHAIVVPTESAWDRGAELIAHCRGRLADFKLPQSVAFAESLPRTPSGKLQKAKLRAPFWEGRARQVN